MTRHLGESNLKNYVCVLFLSCGMVSAGVGLWRKEDSSLMPDGTVSLDYLWTPIFYRQPTDAIINFISGHIGAQEVRFLYS